MQNTPNLNLRKPDYTDFADVSDFNYNSDILDTAIGGTVTGFNDHISDNKVGAHLAKNINIEDVQNNFTATQVEGALQELFTNVSNGKQSIGTAITDVDSTKVIPPNPTFQQLSDIIRTITVGMSSVTGTNNINAGKVTVTGIGVRPKLLVGYWTGNTPSSRYAIYSVAGLAPSSYSLNVTILGSNPQDGGVAVNDDGFVLTFAQAVSNIPIAWVVYS